MAGCLTTPLDNILDNCAARQKVGGATGAKWIGRVSDLASKTLDANGQLTGLTLLAGKRLAKFIGIKNKENFTTEILESEGGQRLRTQSALMQVLAYSQAERNNVDKLGLAEDWFVIAETNEGQFECLGIKNGMSATAFTYATGTEFGANTSIQVTLSGVEGDMQRLCLIGGSAAATIAALDALAEQAPTVISHNGGTLAAAGGEVVQITGTNFTGTTSVQFVGGSTYGTLALPNVLSDTVVEVVTVAMAAGTYDLVVTTPYGVGTLTNGVTVA